MRQSAVILLYPCLAGLFTYVCYFLKNFLYGYYKSKFFTEIVLEHSAIVAVEHFVSQSHPELFSRQSIYWHRKSNDKIKFSPIVKGNVTIFWKRIPLYIKFHEQIEKSDILETTIFVPRKSQSEVNNFVLSCVELYQKAQTQKSFMDVYALDNFGRLQKKSRIDYLSISDDQPILPKSLTIDILQDLKKFSESADNYIERGIRYHRGYCLYGEPGCGKTSLILKIAKEMNMDILLLTGKCLQTEKFTYDQLVGKLLVFEDIDSEIEEFQKNQLKVENGPRKPKSDFPMKELLNFLDGICTPHGSIFVLTCNNLEALPINLLRPGRIDRSYHFTHADEYQIKEIAKRFQVPPKQFYKHANTQKRTMSELQNHLMKFDGNPDLSCSSEIK